MKNSRRDFLKKSLLATAGAYAGSMAFSAKSYAQIIGANDRVRVGVVGFSDRFKSSLLPSFTNHHKELIFDIENLNIRPEFEVLKPYFEKFFKSKTVTVFITAIMNKQKAVTALSANSSDLEKLNR